MKKIFGFALCIFLTPIFSLAAQEAFVYQGKVISVQSEDTHFIEGTDTEAVYQTLSVKILKGDMKDNVVQVSNDYVRLSPGNKIFFVEGISDTGDVVYTVKDVDRRGVIIFFVALFVGAVLIFGGKQGIRSLLSLLGSFFVILYVLLPLLLKGYSPVLVSICIASLVLGIAIYVTHGLKRESTAALLGTISVVAFTGCIAWVGIYIARLTGLSSGEAMMLNFGTQGTLDLSGLLLGGIIIGVLGVLDDIAITQTAVVRELYGSAPGLSPRQIYKKAFRVGKEHVGALVNTLALAYTGASLPLLLFLSQSQIPFGQLITQEIFVEEIIRITVGSIGLILTVPLTTLLAVYMLRKYRGKEVSDHDGHRHHN